MNELNLLTSFSYSGLLFLNIGTLNPYITIQLSGQSG